MRPILFIDRDGTIITEPKDEQIDEIEKFDLLQNVLVYLRKIQRESDYLLVMVSNQDGLGTDSNPFHKFFPLQNMLMRILESQGINFDAIHIDEHLDADGHPNRKPGVGMLRAYLNGQYDIKNSFVIGDRQSDIQLSKNLGCKSVFLGNNPEESANFTAGSWKDIYEYLILNSRKASIVRDTNETKIKVDLNLDGTGETNIDTGLPFFDHMLEQIGKHGQIDLNIACQGDLNIDEHHTIEDTSLTLGEAFLEALGNKRGIGRYGFLLPMDDSLAQIAIDFGGRPWLVWEADFKREKIGDVPTEMFYHFFKSFADSAKCNLNINAVGDNEHHKIEAIFKAFAKSIKMAISRDVSNLDQLPTTKGKL